MRCCRRASREREGSGVSFPVGIGLHYIVTAFGLRALVAQAITQDHLHQEMIRSCRDTDAHSEVEFPSGAQVQVDGREDLLLLFAQGIEAGDRAAGSHNIPGRRRFSG